MKINPLYAGAGALLLAGGGWAGLRLYQRSKLVDLLQNSSMVNQALTLKLVSWTVEEKAADVIGFTNTLTADQGYALVLADLRKLMPADPADLVDLTEDAKRLFMEQTGIDPDAVVAAGADLSSKLIETGKEYAMSAYKWVTT